ncbi:MAG TPA: phosphatase PAP2 family protein [Gaiellaceae bacterium]|nr:phosphatase PAP2 family protein [Gaiellaceae bacterium]
MTSVVAAGRRVLPRGWADFARQLVIWFGFLFAYQIVRGFADRNPARAFWNGYRVIDFERRWSHHLVELTAQHIADSSHWLLTAAAWTYWNSEFTVMGLAILWVYLRRHEHFVRFRNTVLLANVIGLFGYALMPTAPPRMFSTIGFKDTLDSMGSLNHGSGLVQLAANPYAAMPSLHSADALIVAVFLVAASKHWWSKAIWAFWPVWVWFCVMATANHFLLDVLAGIGVALVSLAVVALVPRLRRHRAPETDPIAKTL